jgi:hypothetical protein
MNVASTTRMVIPVAAVAGKPFKAKKPFKKGVTSRWLI